MRKMLLTSTNYIVLLGTLGFLSLYLFSDAVSETSSFPSSSQKWSSPLFQTKKTLPFLANFKKMEPTFQRFPFLKPDLLLAQETSPPLEPSPSTSSDQSFPSLPTDLNVQEETPPPQPLEFPVIFRAYSRAILSSRVTSHIVKITKRMGESFQKGELLIQLDDRIFVGLRRKALGNLAKAQAVLYSKEQLYRQDIASFSELKAAEADVAVAESDLINADYSIESCYIIAPYNGKVVNLLVEEHELIEDGKPLMEIIDDQDLIGQILAPASYFTKLSIGQPIKIYLRDLDTFVIGKILRIDAVIDPASSTFKLDVLVNNAQGKLRAGLIGQTTLETDDSFSGYTSIKPVLVPSRENGRQ